jgi:MoaA/NifB/PqqE/SkfB family radical SAM enzyme
VPELRFAWLEITGKCQLACGHCYADSGPGGDHGSMRVDDWRRVIGELAAFGVTMVQFIGGEPMLHPDLLVLIEYALGKGLRVEVFSNLVHVPAAAWPVLERVGVSLATSYYSDDPAEHAGITGRPVHARTRSNVAEAVSRGIAVRAGVIDVLPNQRVGAAQRELALLGVPLTGTDRVREVGRGVRGGRSDTSQLCGHCTSGVVAISPHGAVWPCVFSRWLPVGNVLEASLADILGGPETERILTGLEEDFAARKPAVAGEGTELCDPQCGPACGPACHPSCWPTGAGPCTPNGGCQPNYD